MKKSILIVSLLCAFGFSLSGNAMPKTLLTSTAVLACGQATPTTDPNFCPTFKAVAQCHCVSSGLPAGMCQDMSLLYQRMVSMFGSIQKACEYQHDTSIQNCVNDWNCYRIGGTDSTGGLCSSTGRAC